MKKLLTILCVFFLANSCFAKPINLYKEPKLSSEVIGVLDSTVGAIKIFTPEESEWSKVADPRDGKVGWVKTNALNKYVCR